jgi:hypothetical protein
MSTFCFGELVRTKTAGEISRTIRIVKEAVQPRHLKTGSKTKFREIPDEDFANFSDLSIISIPLRRTSHLPPRGRLYSQLIHLVHAQATLLADEGLLIRGGVTVGKLVKSWGQLFGPAIIRAYELESKIAKYPRIVVGKEVFDELAANAGLWVRDPKTDQKAVRGLLRKDDDGELFIDYLRIIWDELENPGADYEMLLARHSALIAKQLIRYSEVPAIRLKYEWMDRYHASTVSRLNSPGIESSI